jgi:predicted RNA binding protein YcfA (HicA-like mRNA interferase family)
MSKPDKTLERLARRPAPADIRWSELKAALESLGFKMLSGSGSRVKFFHAAKNQLIVLHKPHPSPNVGKKTIDEIRSLLEQSGFLCDED